MRSPLLSLLLSLPDIPMYHELLVLVVVLAQHFIMHYIIIFLKNASEKEKNLIFTS